ncbi:hypothetical protein D3C80_1791680 [compost metagenome]
MFQATIQVIGPLVVRAHQHTNGRLAWLFKPCASVAANIAVGADLFIIIAQYDDRRLADISGEYIARLFDIGSHCHNNPMFCEEYIHVRFEDVLSTENFTGHTKTWLPRR